MLRCGTFVKSYMDTEVKLSRSVINAFVTAQKIDLLKRFLSIGSWTELNIFGSLHDCMLIGIHRRYEL